MPLDLDALLASETAAFVAAINATRPDSQVPTCPAWDADDLLWHLGEVQHFWAAIVGERMTDPADYRQPNRPDGRERLLSFFDETHASLTAALASANDDDAAWSWFGADQTVGFTRRRQVHEAFIHRIDAELTAGLESMIDPEVAADGVAEVLEVMFGGAPDWGVVDANGPIGRLSCTDLDRNWLIQVQRFSGTSPNSGTTYDGEPVVEIIASGEATFDISATAGNLDRWLWNRDPSGLVTIDGDASALSALVGDGMQ